MTMSRDGSTSPRIGEAKHKPRVLIVEDEGTVGMLFEDMLTDLGYEVGAVATRLKDGLQKAENERYDCAILDVNLDGQPSYPIAQALIKREVPFLFVTGYGAKGSTEDLPSIPFWPSPSFSRSSRRRCQICSERGETDFSVGDTRGLDRRVHESPDHPWAVTRGWR